jgi:hypothetical protein
LSFIAYFPGIYALKESGLVGLPVSVVKTKILKNPSRNADVSARRAAPRPCFSIEDPFVSD